MIIGKNTSSVAQIAKGFVFFSRGNPFEEELDLLLFSLFLFFFEKKK